ncbi:hypothetical protein Tcan_10945 [Toxocara canis]|uniref:Uncharacterized protein n=1 Tax=Toxocara canis TaxID=6265 RepID=A0A0B2V1B5_TOXCA|nr:hypothetical protein Tcan_10945 [Toxocara canis]
MHTIRMIALCAFACTFVSSMRFSAAVLSPEAHRAWKKLVVTPNGRENRDVPDHSLELLRVKKFLPRQIKRLLKADRNCFFSHISCYRKNKADTQGMSLTFHTCEEQNGIAQTLTALKIRDPKSDCRFPGRKSTSDSNSEMMESCHSDVVQNKKPLSNLA